MTATNTDMDIKPPADEEVEADAGPIDELHQFRQSLKAVFA